MDADYILNKIDFFIKERLLVLFGMAREESYDFGFELQKILVRLV